MKKLLIFFTLIPLFIQAQDCDCRSSFNWLKTTFENNDAGYPMVIEEKGIDVYNKFSDSVANVSDNITNDGDCVELLNEWAHFFRKGHVGVSYAANASKNDKESNNEVKNYNPKTYVIDTIKLFNQLRQQNSSYGIVGVWEQRSYTMAIVPDTIDSKRDYVGIVLSTSKPEWKLGQVKAEFFNTDSGNYVNYYMSDRSLVKGDYEYSTENLRTARFYWTRSAEYVPSTDQEQFSIYSTREPLFKQINDETVLLRVPSFEYTNRKKINELLTENAQFLDSAKYFIIDLRGNGGGSDNSFSRILPYIYTNPIKLHSVEIRATPLTYASYKEMTKRSFVFRLYFALSLKKKFKKNMGSYFNLFKDSIMIKDHLKPREYPQKVFVVVDEDCASSTEQFILNAEQSSKTTIIGKRTYGAIDVSNIVNTDFPNNKYRLYYAASRSLRMSSRKIDDIGIEPDITIPDSIPKYKWLEYIEENMLKE